MSGEKPIAEQAREALEHVTDGQVATVKAALCHTHPHTERAKKLIHELREILQMVDLTTPFERISALDVHGASLKYIERTLDVWAEMQWRKLATERVSFCGRCGGTGNELLTMYRQCEWCKGTGRLG
jgi:hypothetical protein